ncbi:MAG: hypothetical protein HC851_24360 [Acaryochloris sp. RU_4_1]|nr:hypothetical protein [Acaryochloris sp. RU_4_1]
MANVEDNNQVAAKVEILWNVASNRAWSLKFQHWVGYGLLILATFDLIVVFVPPNFTNPLWEFQTLGSLVEMVAVPLIGLALVYPGKRDGRSKWEIRILGYLSSLTLLAGILYWLLVPLGIVNTMRIDRENGKQITEQLNQEITKIQILQNQLSSVNNDRTNGAIIKTSRTKWACPRPCKR